jgi:hypothetical protein
MVGPGREILFSHNYLNTRAIYSRSGHIRGSPFIHRSRFPFLAPYWNPVAMKLDAGVGTCGKEGQSVPVGVGQPTLKIDALTVGGTG